MLHRASGTNIDRWTMVVDDVTTLTKSLSLQYALTLKKSKLKRMKR